MLLSEGNRNVYTIMQNFLIKIDVQQIGTVGVSSQGAWGVFLWMLVTRLRNRAKTEFPLRWLRGLDFQTLLSNSQVFAVTWTESQISGKSLFARFPDGYF